MCICNWIKSVIKWFTSNDEDDDFVYYTPSEPTDTNVSSGNKKKALLVGINKYICNHEYDLNGCVNDIIAIKEILIDNFGFRLNDIKILTDENATKENILDGLQWLISNTIDGDELLFYYSGHGSQIIDEDEIDETIDRLDEIICPTDMNWDEPLTDDILHSYFKNIPDGVFLNCVIDACHSGTITRSLQNNTVRFIPYPKNRKPKRSVIKRKFAVSNWKEEQNHILLSGCTDEQTSEDAYIEDNWRGAMSWAFTTALKNANYNSTWDDIYLGVLKLIEDNQFEQTPQLTGSYYLKDRYVFGGSVNK